MKRGGSGQMGRCERQSGIFSEGVGRAVQLVAAGAAGVMLGCGDEDEGYRTTNSAVGIVAREPGFVPLACDTEYASPLYLTDLRPAEPVDYLALRTGDLLLESSGTACSGAEEPSVCQAALDALPEEPTLRFESMSYLVSYYHLAGTRGDDVLRVGTLAELHAFLGEIDAIGEAQLLAATQGYVLLCGESGSVPVASGYNVLGFSYQGCDGRTRHLLHVHANGQSEVLDHFVERDPEPGCIPGRRPEALPRRGVARSSLGRFLAGCAELEAASVPAFLRLARELDAHGAPRGLVRRALGSAKDEVRHARQVAALARGFGGSPQAPCVPVGGVRGLEHVALENAVEGCVHETYAALVALHQGLHSPEPALAASHRRIAADELRHAELAWDTARWLEPRLSAPARRRVSAARRSAASSLVRGLGRSRAGAVDAVAGLPPPALAAAVAEELHASLWQRGIG